jgi:hypothetical protein
LHEDSVLERMGLDDRLRDVKIDRIAQQELEEAAGWYEQQRLGLGFEFIEEVDRVLARIETHASVSVRRRPAGPR